jgi:hypothetical protein
VTCDSGSILGCTVASFPWIIGGLAAIVVLLLLLRLALTMRGRWPWRRSAPAPATAPTPRTVAPGTPLHQTASGEEAKPVKRQAPPPKASPLQLQIIDKPDLVHGDFATSDAQGDFGEALTDIILALDGWKKLESKFGNGGRGIDGLFVREVRGGGGFEALAVETKTNESAYSPATMSDAKLEKDLNALYEQGAFGKAFNEATARELIRGLKGGPPFFRKELWRHSLSSGMTAVTQLGPDGEQRQGTMRSHARLIAGLHQSLKQLDRRGVYFAGPSIDDTDN